MAVGGITGFAFPAPCANPITSPPATPMPMTAAVDFIAKPANSIQILVISICTFNMHITKIVIVHNNNNYYLLLLYY